MKNKYIKIKSIFSKKNRLLYCFIFIVLVIFILSTKTFKSNAPIFIALLVGIYAAISDIILRLFFPPLFKLDIVEVQTQTNIQINEKYYLLFVKNEGFREAKNLRVKIRDGENKAWDNLLRPFSYLDTKDYRAIELSTLSSNESEYFTIGFIEPVTESFTLNTNARPYSQKFYLEKNSKKKYFFEVIADNTVP